MLPTACKSNAIKTVVSQVTDNSTAQHTEVCHKHLHVAGSIRKYYSQGLDLILNRMLRL